MMANSSDEELFRYYNERAPEYEDAYHGKFFTEVPDPTIFQNDVNFIKELLPDYVKGKCLDIACGTGFWLPVYEKHCFHITLIDQSGSMLAECRKKVDRLDIGKKCAVIQENIYDYRYAENQYDSIIIGFLISHMVENELNTFMDIVRKTLKPSGSFVIIDNIWDYARKQLRRKNAGIIKRYLKDGREFNIYKKYFSQADLRVMAKEQDFALSIIYWGKVFFLAAGQFKVNQA